jgi:hypothetical protein
MLGPSRELYGFKLEHCIQVARYFVATVHGSTNTIVFFCE